MLLRCLPTLSSQKRFPSLSTQTAVVLEELISVILGMISVAKKWWANWAQCHDLTHLQVCPTLKKCQESTWALRACVHLFVLNWCCGESSSLSSKNSHPDTELLFQSLFLVCAGEVVTGNHCATVRAPSDGMPLKLFLLWPATWPLVFKHGLKPSRSGRKCLVIRPWLW